jgi:hypothetical protein
MPRRLERLQQSSQRWSLPSRTAPATCLMADGVDDVRCRRKGELTLDQLQNKLEAAEKRKQVPARRSRHVRFPTAS